MLYGITPADNSNINLGFVWLSPYKTKQMTIPAREDAFSRALEKVGQ